MTHRYPASMEGPATVHRLSEKRASRGHSLTNPGSALAVTRGDPFICGTTRTKIARHGHGDRVASYLPTAKGSHARLHRLFGPGPWSCVYCNRYTHCPCTNDGNPPASIEHMIPTSRGGSDQPWNLAVACLRCNVSKGNRRWPTEWVPDLGFGVWVALDVPLTPRTGDPFEVTRLIDAVNAEAEVRRTYLWSISDALRLDYPDALRELRRLVRHNRLRVVPGVDTIMGETPNHPLGRPMMQFEVPW